MPSFTYKAKDPQGKVISGVIEAETERAVVTRLRAQRYTPIKIAEKKPTAIGKFLTSIGLAGRVGVKPLALFSRQLSTLINAGIPIIQSLNILAEQLEHKALKETVSMVRQDIERGSSIAEALNKHPRAFSSLYVAMVRSGEAGGVLDDVLERLSSYLENVIALQAKIRGAMAYPGVVTGIAIIIVTGLLTFVVPAFEEIFSSFGAQLPLPTRILLAISAVIRHYLPLVLLCGIALFFVFMWAIKTEKGRGIWDKTLLKLPIFGVLFQKTAIARFARTLSTLVKSGVPILEALEIVAKTSGNKVVEDAIMESRIAIREGERIADPLKECPVFPPMVIQMVAVGEETGSLDLMLSKIADYYDREVDAAVAALSSMIEPLLILFLGITCGSVIIALFLPILTMSAVISEAT
ncbi:TPA: pilus assembly protein PilC [bacterium]|nr:pilus assembly protein PilC [bacterium]